MTLPSLKDAIRIHGLDAKKSFGQHFLLDPGIVARIAALAGDMTGRHVVEIGPGPGGLTRALLDTKAEAIHAVEIDQRAWPLLDELVAHAAGRLVLTKADATSIDTSGLCPAPRKVVANLPYNVGTPLLVGWLRQAALWERMTLMFQLEVAERICAVPDSSHYGRLGVLAQWCADCTVVMKVPAGAFSPPPKVESAVVDLIPKAEQPSPALFKAMEHVTHLAFGQRRKMLRASLRPIGGEALLEKAGILATRRAETLSIEEFATLARLVCPER
ncbi:16S rRNA (adenine(1518)-N(6)/adenine(1519)-N(6))-dimethyltransferase RsmA [Asaia astilbis]|uniref:16S rRNA (adenine(1518)-N(6)/adenine(1519)-N(6))- dimethyltransferase RsmA n=1 Tax=Asaia astilbis TaxID=610244 RepID=UPI00046FA647|nr:16S rRNA (adenine(1518)-N(6)/adenine(1519)-N(6))-dimethyltransferase RsmA [Asaia astilbis]